MFSRALVLLVLTATACWPAWSLPDWDGTEGRRVQIAWEMVRSGDWMVPTLGGEPTWAKPPLHYWLLATCLEWFGENRLLLRLPSVLSAFVAAWLAGELLRRWFDPRIGWVAAIGIATSPLVIATWPTAEIDPLFASATAMSLWCLATGVAHDRRGLVLAAGLLGGVALLQKGPPYFLFAVGAWLVWWRHRRLRGGSLYLGSMLAVALLYYVPLWVWWIEPAEMLAVANEESVGRLAYMTWDHFRQIPGYWARAIGVLLPMGAFCFWEWRGARDARMSPHDLMLRMCSGGAVVAVVLLTFFPGRPTRYLLPNVLLFAFAVAPAVAHFQAFSGVLPAIARGIVRAAAAVGLVAAVVLPFVPRATPGAIAFAVLVSVASLLVRTPRHLVWWCAALPLLGGWTVGIERSANWPTSKRARLGPAAGIAADLRGLDVRDEDLCTWGHFDSALLLVLQRLSPGDEWARRAPPRRWVLLEAESVPQVPPAGYEERKRWPLPWKTFVLCERQGPPR